MKVYEVQFKRPGDVSWNAIYEVPNLLHLFSLLEQSSEELISLRRIPHCEVFSYDPGGEKKEKEPRGAWEDEAR
jgi:hypothetical protein